MGYAELIALEVQNLPAKYQAEVFSFVTALKAQGEVKILAHLSVIDYSTRPDPKS